MSTVFSLGQTSLPEGATVIPKTAVPANATSATLTLGRCTTGAPTLWPNVTTTVSIALEVSYDGGVTFLPGGGFTASGGIFVRRGVESDFTTAIFGYSIHPTHIQGTVTVTNGPMVTTVSIAVA